MVLTCAPAEAADAAVIFSFCKALIDTYEDTAAIDYEKVLNWVRRKIENHIDQYTCVFADSEKAGFFRISESDGMAELDDLYILPEFRNRGIGTAVIQKCCAETSVPLMLYVFTKNTGAMALYRRLGFRVQEYVGNTRCIMVRLPQENL